MSDIDAELADEAFCYLTTTGRVSGLPREIEIWFRLHDGTLYMLSGGGERSDWVKNIRHGPQVTVRIGDVTFDGHARFVEDEGEMELARQMLFDKYQPTYRSDLRSWRRRSLPVAVDLGTRRA